MTAIAPTITADLTLEIVPLSGTIGAEIRGVDPKRPLDQDTVDAVPTR
jgi:alpha-ketoglutarate-dependent taurine dioxygenase